MGKSKERKFNLPREDKELDIKKRTSNPLGATGASNRVLKRKVSVPKMSPKKAETIKTNLPSERVKSSTPQKSMGQIGREMAKSGPRKNLRETVAAVKGKLQNAYNKATGRKSISVEMDGKTFSGYERGNSRKAVVKVSNPTSGSSKMVDKFDRSGKLKSQKFVDRNAEGKKIQVIKRKG